MLENIRILYVWSRIRSSLWFVPGILVCGSIALSFFTLIVDENIRQYDFATWWWIYKGGLQGALSVLSTIAGSMITVAGVTFSITIVALTLASSQLGPRILRNFMSDTFNQIVLGTFISTFTYCLLILRAVRPGEQDLIPHLSVTIAMIFAILSLWILIYFIHHMSVSIQADHVIAEISRELEGHIFRLYPAKSNEPIKTSTATFDHDPTEDLAVPIFSESNGYLQAVDVDQIFEKAVKQGFMIEIFVRAGQYINRSDQLAVVYPKNSLIKDDTIKIKDSFVLGSQRTSVQDIEFAVHQLVEIGLRALSPGINDPYTAIACIDRLGTALSELVRRDQPEEILYHEDGIAYVKHLTVSFESVVDASFNQIRQHANHLPAIVIRLLETINTVARYTERQEQKIVLLKHIEAIEESVKSNNFQKSDLLDIYERYGQVKKTLSQG